MSKHVFMMPHPPIILNEIGGADSKLANCTVTGMTILAKQIAEIKPDTIIFVTPHGNSFSNGTCLLNKIQVSGDFKAFGYPEITFKKNIDRKLTNEINDILEEHDILSLVMDDNLADQYKVKAVLDHGVMVPMYFIDKEYDDYEIVHITPGFTPLSENFMIGTLIRNIIETYKNDKKIVFVASGDLSHALSNNGPYAYHEDGPVFDNMVQDAINSQDPLILMELEQEFIDNAAQCGLRSILMGFGIVDEYKIHSKVVSYEGPFGVGYMTGYIEGYERTDISNAQRIQNSINEHYLSRIALEDDYVRLARKSIESFVLNGTKLAIDESEYTDGFIRDNKERQSGAFVSIHIGGKLRGCIGTIEATADHLIDEIIYNGISACSKDPRFHPVEEDELPYLDIKVDILYPSEKIQSIEALDPKVYGVIVEQGYKRGLLLPNLEGIDKAEEQVRIAKEKARIISGDIEMYRFKVERHEISKI